MDTITSVGKYRRGLRTLARLVKIGKRSAIERVAELMAARIPNGCSVVPMPSHSGRATVMLEVARLVCKRREDLQLCDVLTCEPHAGVFEAKRNGLDVPSVRMSAREMPQDAVVIDNVIDTGTTWNAARRAIPSACLLTVARVSKRGEAND